MGVLDRVKKCASDPAACAGAARDRVVSTYNNQVRPAASQAGHSTTQWAGKTAGNAYKKGADLFHCPPGSACRRERAEAARRTARENDWKKNYMDPNKTYKEKMRTADGKVLEAERPGEEYSDAEYARRVKKRTADEKAVRDAEYERYRQTTKGRVIEGGKEWAGRASTAKVSKSADPFNYRPGRGAAKVGSVAARPRGRPPGSGRGHYTRNGPRYANTPEYREENYAPIQQRPRRKNISDYDREARDIWSLHDQDFRDLM